MQALGLIDTNSRRCLTGLMNTSAEKPQQRNSRRPFSAKYSNKEWGWGLLVLGGIAIAGGSGAQTPLSKLGWYVFAVALILWSVYMLRGKGLSPKKRERMQYLASVVADEAKSALEQLRIATGGTAVVKYRNLVFAVKKMHVADTDKKLEEMLASIDFDKKTVRSPYLGGVMTTTSNPVEVFQDWIIYGQVAYDVEEATRGVVHLDGAFGTDAKGATKDFRTAEIQFVSTNWSVRAQINPNDVNEARRVVIQLSLITEALRPSAVTTDDIASMVQAILTNTGQPAAQRIEQLDALRYQHLLSDDEFEAAKTKVLGI